MTKKLQELFDLPEMVDEDEILETIDPQQALAESTEILNALSNSEKLDTALTSVSGISEHDDQMDDIAEKAIDSYQTLMTLGMNVSDAHAGRIFESSNLMLETALKARDSKINRKLKTLELQLKKARLDHDIKVATGASKDDDDDKGTVFDRNELLRIITQESEKK
jgi:hypothetical protein